MNTITFYGAAGGVTGSKHLLEIGDERILLDCGTFQGLPDIRERNRSLPFPPESIDHVVLSHAHQDHCGMLPLLVKRGFTGSIFATPATRDVTARMLTDSAGIEVQDAEYRQRHHIGPPDDRQPQFTPEDIPPTIDHFVDVPYVRESKDWHSISDTMKLKFYDAGHILGSAVTVLEFPLNGKQFRLAYTGDLGSSDMPLLPDPEPPLEPIDLLLMESTYGSRVHEGLDKALDRLAQAITDICNRGGKMIVPAFSLGRTQMFVYVVHKLTDEGRIPRFPIFVDSPLATDITDVHRAHKGNYDTETVDDFGEGHGPLSFRNLSYTRSVEESKRLNDMQGPLMIISASGMMTAGRVVHHLRHSISNPANAVFITGYQAEGTLGRRILEGAKRVELYGDWFDVKAQTFLFNEFSAHADSVQLQQYAEAIPSVKQIALVHGEPHQADDFKAQLEKAHPEWKVVRPSEGDVIDLDQ
ncbi:MAG: MBL fold metallo-hydrolase [Candidatus Andersenbacteria bacterium]